LKQVYKIFLIDSILVDNRQKLLEKKAKQDKNKISSIRKLYEKKA